MSHSLASLSFCMPMASQKITANSNLYFSRCPGHGVTSIKARAGNGGDSLDHLQRQQTKSQPRQPAPPKKRLAQVAPIGLWDRFPNAKTVQQMMETMERVMEDPFAYGGGWASAPLPTESGGYSRGRTPWEIKEGEGVYKMRLDMPGMTKEDVKVWVEEKMLVVKAEKLPREEREDDDAEWSAKSYGRYSSRIALPDNVQFEKIKGRGQRWSAVYHHSQSYCRFQRIEHQC